MRRSPASTPHVGYDGPWSFLGPDRTRSLRVLTLTSIISSEAIAAACAAGGESALLRCYWAPCDRCAGTEVSRPSAMAGPFYSLADVHPPAFRQLGEFAVEPGTTPTGRAHRIPEQRESGEPKPDKSRCASPNGHRRRSREPKILD